MKRYIPALWLLLLCAVMLCGCHQTDPSTPGSTPQADLPPVTSAPTTAPTGPAIPDGMVLVYVVTGYACEGKDTAFVYDETGRLLEMTVDGQVVFQRTYDTQGNCLSYKNVHMDIDQTYDAQGNTLTDRTAEGLLINTYDEAGRCVSVQRQSPDGVSLSVTRYGYDDKGNLLSEVFEVDGIVDHEILHTYDEAGHHLTQTYCRDGAISADGPSYTWRYDELRGHLESENIFYGEEFYQGTLYAYDASADTSVPYMKWYSDGSMYQYSHFFDTNGTLQRYTERYTDADKNQYSISIEYQYDAHGNTIMQKMVNHTGQEKIFRWTYAENGVTMTGCSLVSPEENYEYAWIYDRTGRKVQELRTGDDPHEIVWEYDARGKVIREVGSGSVSYKITYVYDEQGNLIQRSYQTGSSTTDSSYTYTAFIVTQEQATWLVDEQREILSQLNAS